MKYPISLRSCAAGLAGLALVTWPAVAGADAAGRALFRSYCASCHGPEARGNGPVAGALVTPPPDLTTLTRRHGIPLDRAKLAEFIDGRLDVRAHGPREMPVWGERFAEEIGPDQSASEAETRRTIDKIVDYILSIQQVQGAAR